MATREGSRVSLVRVRRPFRQSRYAPEQVPGLDDLEGELRPTEHLVQAQAPFEHHEDAAGLLRRSVEDLAHPRRISGTRRASHRISSESASNTTTFARSRARSSGDALVTEAAPQKQHLRHPFRVQNTFL
jgi:hypothetical protein